MTNITTRMRRVDGAILGERYGDIQARHALCCYCFAIVTPGDATASLRFHRSDFTTTAFDYFFLPDPDFSPLLLLLAAATDTPAIHAMLIRHDG